MVWTALAPHCGIARDEADGPVRRLLYVATPGVRNYLEYGGHGVLVFDTDRGHAFVRRIASSGIGSDGRPLNVKGICASARTQRLYVSTLEHLICIDLMSDRVLWERSYEGGCDRMAISPDGQVIYLPTLEKDHWKVVDAEHGDEVARITPDSGAHNTVFGLDGRRVYLAGLKSPMLTVADASTHKAAMAVGPFGGGVRPFTVNGRQTLCFATVNGLLGFEVGDLVSGQMMHRVEVEGYQQGPVKRHGCPSHGIGMSPDESELWVCDSANQSLHVYDATEMPPRQIATVKLRDEPGWVTFSISGDLVYPSTGEVIERSSRRIVAALIDEEGRHVQSEKMLPIDFQDGKPLRTGDQFGLGRVLEPR
jgi:DNA-binding beta-propeller fold protein YncE